MNADNGIYLDQSELRVRFKKLHATSNIIVSKIYFCDMHLRHSLVTVKEKLM